jgi:hypothetical protein
MKKNRRNAADKSKKKMKDDRQKKTIGMRRIIGSRGHRLYR